METLLFILLFTCIGVILTIILIDLFNSYYNSSLGMKQFKRKLAKQLTKLLLRLDPYYYKEVKVNLDRTIQLRGDGIIPLDNEWHQCSINVNFWIRKNEEGIRSEHGEYTVFDNGKLNTKLVIEERQTTPEQLLDRILDEELTQRGTSNWTATFR